MNVSTKQKQTHKHRKQNLWLLKGGMDWEFGISRCKLLYRMDKQSGPTV